MWLRKFDWHVCSILLSCQRTVDACRWNILLNFFGSLVIYCVLTTTQRLLLQKVHGHGNYKTLSDPFSNPEGRVGKNSNTWRNPYIFQPLCRRSNLVKFPPPSSYHLAIKSLKERMTKLICYSETNLFVEQRRLHWRGSMLCSSLYEDGLLSYSSVFFWNFLSPITIFLVYIYASFCKEIFVKLPPKKSGDKDNFPPSRDSALLYTPLYGLHGPQGLVFTP